MDFFEQQKLKKWKLRLYYELHQMKTTLTPTLLGLAASVSNTLNLPAAKTCGVAFSPEALIAGS